MEIFSLNDFDVVLNLFENDVCSMGLLKEIVDNVKFHGKCGHIEELPLTIKKRFAVASEISPEGHLNMVTAAQKYNDESISKTINLSNNITPDYIVKIIIEGFQMNIKGITVFRENCLEERN